MKKTNVKEKIIHFAKTYTIFFVLIAVFLIFAVYKGKRFVNPINLLNVVRQCAVVGIVCCGYSFVMISGGSDISTGWQMNLCMALMAKFMVDLGMNPVIAVLVGILGCIACQCLNQYIGLKLNLGGFMVTLATQNIFQGITYLYTDGRTVNNLPEGFNFVGQDYIFGNVPVAAIVLVICTIITHIVLNKTIFGRYVFAIGGNEQAAKLSGINVNKYKMLIAVWCGVFIGIASFVMLSRMNSMYPNAATGYEFKAILACSVGGLSSQGGVGKVFGMFCGALTISLLTNGMSIAMINDYWQIVTNGVLMLCAVAFDQIVTRRTIAKAKLAQAKETRDREHAKLEANN